MEIWLFHVHSHGKIFQWFWFKYWMINLLFGVIHLSILIPAMVWWVHGVGCWRISRCEIFSCSLRWNLDSWYHGHQRVSVFWTHLIQYPETSRERVVRTSISPERILHNSMESLTYCRFFVLLLISTLHSLCKWLRIVYNLPRQNQIYSAHTEVLSKCASF